MIQIEKEQVYVYLGKTIGTVHQYDRFKNGIPNDLRIMVSKEPLLERMIIPVEQFLQAKQDIETDGTVLNNVYKQIDKRLGGE